MTKVLDVMTKTVRCCRSSDAADVPAQIMWEHSVGIVPVLFGRELVGVVTDRDIAMAAYGKRELLEKIPVDTIMSREVRFCAPEDRLQAAEHVMAKQQVRRLPVIDQGDVVGLLSMTDLALASEASPLEVTPGELTRTLGAICADRSGAA